jgi:ABC-2 type transport system permease protein
MALAFLLPLLLLVFFGYAISWDVRAIRTAVWDQDGTARSRALLAAFWSSGYFLAVEPVAGPAAIRGALDEGRASLVLVVPRGFAADVEAGRTARLQALVDGSDANTATIALAYARAVALGHGAGLDPFTSPPLTPQPLSPPEWGERGPERGLDPSGPAARRSIPQAAAGTGPPLRLAARVWYNEELSSRNMIVPGLVSVIMMIIAAMLTSLTLAREWERGTMEQLAATPVTRVEVVLGKLLPYVAIGLVDVAAISWLGVLLFGVPFRGSVLLLALLSFLFLLGASGLGIFVSAGARSQLLATQVAILVSYLPSLLLSGFMFAIAVMPAPLRALTYLVPARYFLVVTRGIFLKGVGLDVLAGQALLMLLFAAAGIGLAVLRFRKELA